MDFDVIVAGAGPTGLMAAAELALGGARPVVFERLAARSQLSRAGGVTPRTAELFDQRGLLEPLLATGDYPEVRVGQFAGLPVDFGRWPSRHPGYFVTQATIETFLEHHLAGLDVPVLWGHPVVDVLADADGVTVVVDGPRRHRARYLVAADGARSTVRKALNIDFPGRPGTCTAVISDVVLTGASATVVGHAASEHGHWALQFPLEDGLRRLVLGGPGSPPACDRDTPVTEKELRRGIEAVYGGEVELVELRRAVRIDDAARQLARYRHGPVFFAGDAAHIHLPLGGQGMNLGIGDAVNLGWKLAASVRGWAPPGLLDSYQHERHPVGAGVLANTRAQSLLMDWPGTANPDRGPLRALIGELLTLPDTGRALAGMMTGLDIRYPLGGDDPLVGMRMPDLDLVVDGRPTRVAELLRTGRGLLLHPEPRADLPGAPDRVNRVDRAQAPTELTLVRPDGHVCWAHGPGTVERALKTWFGRA
ncbi:FAD-dependent monooxygenase [Pseudonocardia acaciae]|uniref:FAD-dependent monooxygenase n=1 Tax=Pseudonocardia acaciae TaxID=551276 RepID=UPI000490D751|nr:FAD-dependent monooxygenase [Pseudonocardia acaciae]